MSLPAAAQGLNDAWQHEISYRKTGMVVLGSWAVANIAGGMALRAGTDGRARYFHEMNAIWNTVNLGIAVAGYYGAVRLGEPAGVAELYTEQMKLEKTLLFNAGLDLAYIAGGLYMTERARNMTDGADRWQGYGRSVMLQGAFLFAFDVMMVVLHNPVQLPEGLQLGFAPGGPQMLNLVWRF
jgi:hypothetical protein